MRRFLVKLALLPVAAAVLLLSIDALVFHASMRSELKLGGPVAVHEYGLDFLLNTHFDRVPTLEPGPIAPPLAAPIGVDDHSWYSLAEARRADAQPLDPIEAPAGAIRYSLGAGPEMAMGRGPEYPRFPIVFGYAIILSDERVVARASVHLRGRSVRSREFIGAAHDLTSHLDSPRWRTRIWWSALAQWSAVLVALFGWLFFVREMRAGVRLVRAHCTRDAAVARAKKRYQRPGRYMAIKSAVIAILALALLVAVERIFMTLATHHGWSLAPDVTTEQDISWWRRNVGEPPPVTRQPIVPPPAMRGREGTWYYRDGGRGGAGASAWGGPAPEWSIAYVIVPDPLLNITLMHDPLIRIAPVLRGRAVAASDGVSGLRVGVALPMVMFERSYIGPSHASLPHIVADDGWRVRVRPLGLLVNFALLFALLALPMHIIRDVRALARLRRSRCPWCGYTLQHLTGEHCPECGWEIPARLRGGGRP